MTPKMERMVGIFLLLMSLLITLYNSQLFTVPLSYTPGGWVLLGVIVAASLWMVVDSILRTRRTKRK